MGPKLFNPTYNTSAQEFKKYLPVNINLRFETVSSYLALAEENYIETLLGSSLFSRMVSYYVANPTLPTECDDKTLIEKVRFAIVRLAIWKGYDVINSNISDTGVSTAVDKENRLYRYQEENIKKSLKNEGFDYLDNVLSFLESKSNVFPEFASSEYVTTLHNSLIHNTKSFNECYNIENSRLVFLKMKKFVRDVELIKLQHRVGAAFYNELLTADESVAKYAAILPNIRRFVVYEAVAEGIGELHKIPTDKGLVFEGSDADGYIESPIDRARIAETMMQFSDKAEKYLAVAINYIKQNKSNYPNYTSFAGDSPADGVVHIDNTKRKTFLA